MEDNFLTQLVNEATKGSALLDLLLVNREGLVGDVKVGCHLGHSGHELIQFSILRNVGGGVDVGRTTPLDVQRADFVLLRIVVD